MGPQHFARRVVTWEKGSKQFRTVSQKVSRKVGRVPFCGSTKTTTSLVGNAFCPEVAYCSACSYFSSRLCAYFSCRSLNTKQFWREADDAISWARL